MDIGVNGFDIATVSGRQGGACMNLRPPFWKLRVAGFMQTNAVFSFALIHAL